MKNTRIGILGLSSAVAGFMLQGCFATQPPPECQVFTGDAITEVSNYMSLLTETSRTGTCETIDHMEIGLTRLNAPGSKDFFVLMRAARPVDFVIGHQFSESIDPTNDCSDYANTEDCSACVDPAMAVEGDNVCEEVLDPVTRSDKADPEAKGLTVKAKLSQYPDSTGFCSIDPVTTSFNFQKEDLDLVDGGTTTLPAISQKLEWSDFKLMMNAKVPGSFFTAKLKLSEGSCVANYDVKAFWPIVTCTTDDECDPAANVDAGRATGSGISADFAPICNKTIGVCVPSADVASLK